MSSASEVVYYDLNTWRKLRILIKKSFNLQTSQHLTVSAIIFCPILIFFYSQLNHFFIEKAPTLISDNKYPSIDLELPNVTEIFYSPQNAVLDEIVTEVAVYLESKDPVAFQHASDLERALIKEDAFVGIQFEDRLRNIKLLPNKIKVALRFPNHLRSQKDDVWPNRLYRKMMDDFEWKPDPYIDEGYLAIQIKLCDALIRMRNQSVSIPPVYLQQFPDKQHYLYTNLISPFRQLITVFPFLFVISSLFISENIIEEKQRHTRDIIRLMGLSIGLNWLSWFIVIFLLVSIPMLVIGILMKIMLCPATSIVVLLLICVTYVFGLVSFICMVTVFIGNSFLAIVSICIFHILSFLPFYLMNDIISWAKLVVVCFFFNSAMPFVLIQLLGFELIGKGITLSTLFMQPHPDDYLSCGSILLLMWVSGFLRLVFCLYVDQLFPAQFGVHRKWYYPLKRNYWCPWQSPRLNSIHVESVLLGEDQKNVQKHVEVTNKKDAVVELQNLTMVVNGEPVVQDFSLNLYDSEITVLTGNNGSGKSTIFMMVAGMYEPTEGTILINGNNMSREFAVEYARASIGICPQQDVLLEGLSPYKHIVFFSEIKGYSRANADAEARKYLEKISLMDKAHIRVGFLPNYMRRKLALCCALCAGTKVVLLDMPTSEMDSTARQEMWDLLLSEKMGRCIFITTIYTSAAEVVADRVALISEGKLIAHGSRDFLLNSVGSGYKLVCNVQEDCDVNNLTMYLKKYNVTWESKEDNDVIYHIPKEYEKKLSKITFDLQKKETKLKLKSFEIIIPTLKEIIWKLSTDILQPRATAILSSTSGWMKFATGQGETSRLIRLFNVCHALFISKLRYTLNYIYFILFLILLPIGLSLLSFLISSFEDKEAIDPYNLRLYPQPIILTCQTTNSLVPYVDYSDYGVNETVYEYSGVASTAGATIKRMQTVDIDEFLQKNLKLGKSLSFVAACTFHPSTIIAWFNRELYHGSALSLNLLYKAIGKVLAKMEIEVINMPRPDSNPDAFTSGNVTVTTKPATLITLYLCLIMACFATYIIQDKMNQMRQLYFLADFHNATYWLLNLLFDYTLFLICMISILVSLYLSSLSLKDPEVIDTILWMMFLLLAFGFSALTLTYLLSFAFHDSNSGLSCIILINFVIAIIALYLHPVSKQEYYKILHTISMFLPYYALYSAMRIINLGGHCLSIRLGTKCKSYSGYPRSAKIWNEINCLIISGVFYLILILLYTHLNHLRTLFQKFGLRKDDTNCSLEGENDDVKAERDSVDDIANNADKLKECDLLLQDVTKRIQRTYIVKCMSFKIMQ